VIKISNGAVVTVDGFTITGGNGTTNAGQGGGIAIQNARAQILNNLITGNLASNSSGVGGSGGGIHIINSTSPVLISGNTIQANVAYSVTTGSQVGLGGGIMVSQAGAVMIAGNQVLSNVAAQMKNPSTTNAGYGGGIHFDGASLILENNTIRGNLGIPSGDNGFGGGVNIDGTPIVTLTNNIIVENTAIITGDTAGGGGVSVGVVSGSGQRLTLIGNWVMSNTAGVNLSGPEPFASGGGVFIFGGGASNETLIAQNNHLIGNVAVVTMTSSTAGYAEGGGLSVADIATVIISNNEVRGNSAGKKLSLNGNSGSGGFISGGGLILSIHNTVTVTGNEIRDNVAAHQQVVNKISAGAGGGGLRLLDAQNATISANTISGNITVITGSLTSNAGGEYQPFGGGIMVDCSNQFNCYSSFVNNDILNNSAAQTLTIAGSNAYGRASGGGLSFFSSRANLSQNHILNNRACFTGPSCEFALRASQSVLTSTNDVFANNISGGVGIDGSPTPSQARFINDTFYNNSFVGMEVNDAGNTLYVTNTIISNHQIGLRRNDAAATLVSNFNLLRNTTDYAGGASPGAQDITDQNPLFVNAAGNDFHLTSASPAIDKGTAAGAPSVDFENNTRPQGLGVDIGADEFQGNVYLPIVLK
jgi:hypothetical protein